MVVSALFIRGKPTGGGFDGGRFFHRGRNVLLELEKDEASMPRLLTDTRKELPRRVVFFAQDFQCSKLETPSEKEHDNGVELQEIPR
jgi:hypothetical protein